MPDEQVIDKPVADDANPFGEGSPPVAEPEIKPGEPVVTKEGGDQAFQENVQRQLAELKEKLGKHGEDPGQIEKGYKDIEASTGFKKSQVDFMLQAIQKAVVSQVGDLKQGAGKDQAKATLGAYQTLFPQVEEMMAKQPPEVRANPDSWKQAAFMILGQNVGKLVAGKAPGDKTVITGSPLISGGSGGAPPSGTRSVKQYTALEQADRQQMANRYFKGSLEEMDKYQAKGKTIGQTADKAGGTNSADAALFRLTGGKTG